MSVEKYGKKPVEIEALQWDGSTEGATEVIDWILGHGGSARFRDNPPMMHGTACQCDGRGVIPGGHLTADLIPCPETEPTGGKPPDIAIGTLEGTMTASPGDWIIRGVQGEFHPCRPDIFAATYESPAGKVFDVPGGVDWFDVCVQLRENNAFLTDDDCKAAASLIEAVLRARGEWPYV